MRPAACWGTPGDNACDSLRASLIPIRIAHFPEVVQVLHPSVDGVSGSVPAKTGPPQRTCR
jgi:hypothetical protein